MVEIFREDRSGNRYLLRGYDDQIIQLGYPPSRIDLLTSIPGVNFEDCYPARFAAELDGVTVNFIDLENLKTNKQASGRTQDLADLENLP